jgi:hypothetical protein
MSQHGWDPDRQRFEDEIRAERNIVFPDTARNGRSVELFLSRGSPNPTTVQRIGAWLFSAPLLGVGLWILRDSRNDGFGALGTFIMGAGFFATSIKIFLNGFPRKQR